MNEIDAIRQRLADPITEIRGLAYDYAVELLAAYDENAKLLNAALRLQHIAREYMDQQAAELAAAHERIAALEGAIRLLIAIVPMDWNTMLDYGTCCYCHKAVAWSDGDESGKHAPDCPWVQAHEAVKGSE